MEIKTNMEFQSESALCVSELKTLIPSILKLYKYGLQLHRETTLGYLTRRAEGMIDDAEIRLAWDDQVFGSN